MVKNYSSYEMEKAAELLGVNGNGVKRLLVSLKQAAKDLDVIEDFPFTGSLSVHTSISFKGEFFYGSMDGPLAEAPKPLPLCDSKELLLGAGGCKNFSMSALVATAEHMAVMRYMGVLTDNGKKTLGAFRSYILNEAAFDKIPTLFKLYHDAEPVRVLDPNTDGLFRLSDALYYVSEGRGLRIDGKMLQMALSPYFAG